MTEDRKLTIYFHRNDGQSERVPLPRGTVSEAIRAIEVVFYISYGLYTSAELYRGGELVETVENPSCIHLESILVH